MSAGKTEVAGVGVSPLQAHPSSDTTAVGIDTSTISNSRAIRLLRERVEHYLENPTQYLRALPEIPEETSAKMANDNNYYVSIADPQDQHYRGSPPHILEQVVLQAYQLQLHIAVQVILLIFTITYIILTFVSTVPSASFLLFHTIVMILQVIVIWAYERSARLAAGKWWELLWLPFSFAMAVIHVKNPDDAWSSFFLILNWIFMAHLTLTQGSRSMLMFCAADRRCYVAEGVVMDLAYITRNIIGMGWPAQGVEAYYRNAWSEVTRFLSRKYAPQSCHVVNLCSERSTAPFQKQSSYPMDDHNPAEMTMMISFCCEMAEFIQEDPYIRVAAIHCKGGKGRTGTMISAYLLYMGLSRSADAALRHFSLLRSRTGAKKLQGVQTPSQERYVRYFERLINEMPNLQIPSRPRRVRRLVLHNVPSLWTTRGIGHLWMAVVSNPCTDRNVLYVSNRTVTFSPAVPDASTYTWRTQARALFESDEEILYKDSNEMDVDEASGGSNYSIDTASFAVLGNDVELSHPEDIPTFDHDVVFKFFFYKNNPNALKPPVQFWLHTGLEKESNIVLTREKLDGPSKDTKGERYPPNFSIEIELEDIVSKRREY